ncbi:MAG: radical SAM protein [bacterium]|nr:radical SAM protein [bacterium]
MNYKISDMISFVRKHNFSQLINRVKKELYLRTTYLNYTPFHIGIYATDRCNLNCRMCLRTATNKEFDYCHQISDDMTLNTFQRIIDRFPRATSVNIAGLGEPFLNPNIFDMIKYANQNNMGVSIITNGILIGDKIKDIIDSSLDSISISINANDSYKYKKVTGSHFFDIVLENVRKLVEMRNKKNTKLSIRISYVCTKSNYKHIPEMIKLAEQLRVDYLDFQNLIPTRREGFTENQCLFDDDYEIVELLSNLPKPNSNLIIALPKLLQRKIKKRLCTSYFTSIRVDANGNVSGCGRVITPNQEYGNIFTDKDVWNLPHFQEMRRMFINHSIPLLDCCRTCVENSSHIAKILCNNTLRW